MTKVFISKTQDIFAAFSMLKVPLKNLHEEAKNDFLKTK